MSGPRVLVCGGRDYADAGFMFRVLEKIRRQIGIGCIIQGECPFGGADALAKMYALCNGIEHADFPARVVAGRVLGPERNARMLKDGRPEIVVAFPGGSGTADMTTKALRARIPTWEPWEMPQFRYVLPPGRMGTLEIER
jgi:hypothetical protein